MQLIVPNNRNPNPNPKATELFSFEDIESDTINTKKDIAKPAIAIKLHITIYKLITGYLVCAPFNLAFSNKRLWAHFASL